MHLARLCAAPVPDVALLLPVQSSRQSPKSGGVPLSSFALLLCPPSLHCLILRFLVTNLSPTPSLVFILSYSPTLILLFSILGLQTLSYSILILLILHP